jgi:hypothetical protein
VQTTRLRHALSPPRGVRDVSCKTEPTRGKASFLAWECSVS